MLTRNSHSHQTLLTCSDSVILSLGYLLSDDISSLCGVWALADDITDLLVTQQEVYAVGGQSQEGVVGVLDLQRQTREVKISCVHVSGSRLVGKLLFMSQVKQKLNVGLLFQLKQGTSGSVLRRDYGGQETCKRLNKTKTILNFKSLKVQYLLDQYQ